MITNKKFLIVTTTSEEERSQVLTWGLKQGLLWHRGKENDSLTLNQINTQCPFSAWKTVALMFKTVRVAYGDRNPQMFGCGPDPRALSFDQFKRRFLRTK